MSDPCLPPPNTAAWSVHVLRKYESDTERRTWTGKAWCIVPGRDEASPRKMAQHGWRYIGPAEGKRDA